MHEALTENTYLNHIGGQWVASVSGQTLDSINPGNKELLAKFQRSNAEDIDNAVKAAQSAFDNGWLDTTWEERAEYLFQIEAAIKENAEQLATIEAMDNGKPYSETSNADIVLCYKHFNYFASVGRTFEDTHAQLPGLQSINYAEPLGVVGMIIPWNFPLLMFSWKVAPALIAGNTIVIKLAEETPLSALELMKKIADILPAGVLNVVTGLGEEAGAPLASHTGIKKLAFTGSTSVGKLVALEAAKNGIPCTTELGGKSPVLVFDDMDLDEAADIAVSAATFNQGEVCTCGSLLVVQNTIREALTAKIVERMKAVKVGDQFDPENTMGAVVSEEQFNRVTSFIDHAKENPEIELLCGDEEVSNDGFFIRPTLVQAAPDSKLAQEEIFGPVLTMTSFDSEEEALEIANGTPYGLGAGLLTNDDDRIYRLTGKKGIKSGRVWVKHYHTYPEHAPFGGYAGSDSGIGRENHLAMIGSYTTNKNVLIKR